MTLFNVIVKVVLPNFHFPLPEKHLVILINTLPCCKKKKKKKVSIFLFLLCSENGAIIFLFFCTPTHS